MISEASQPTKIAILLKVLQKTMCLRLKGQHTDSPSVESCTNMKFRHYIRKREKYLKINDWFEINLTCAIIGLLYMRYFEKDWWVQIKYPWHDSKERPEHIITKAFHFNIRGCEHLFKDTSCLRDVSSSLCVFVPFRAGFSAAAVRPGHQDGFCNKCDLQHGTRAS